MDELRKEFPFPDRHLRLDTWSITQAIFVFYGIDFYEIELAFDKDELGPIAEKLDFEHIKGLLLNHAGYGICPRPGRVNVAEFLPFLERKKISIPSHLNQVGEDALCDDSVRERRPRGTEARKQIMRYFAELVWCKEKQDVEAKGKDPAKLTLPGALAEKKQMKQAVTLINEIGGLEPHAKGIDPEWFSDLYPGE